jgi:hypothetical protein
MPRASTRNSTIIAAAAHEPSPVALSSYDTPQVSDAKKALRTSWKWAYVSHFIFWFEPMLNLAETVTIPVSFQNYVPPIRV